MIKNRKELLELIVNNDFNYYSIGFTKSIEWIEFQHDKTFGYCWIKKDKNYHSLTYSGNGYDDVKFFKTLDGCKRNLLKNLGFDKNEIDAAFKDKKNKED